MVLDGIVHNVSVDDDSRPVPTPYAGHLVSGDVVLVQYQNGARVVRELAVYDVWDGHPLPERFTLFYGDMDFLYPQQVLEVRRVHITVV